MNMAFLSGAILSLSLFYGVSVGHCTAQEPTAAKRVSTGSIWLSDLDRAVALAHSSGKPLLILFRCEP